MPHLLCLLSWRQMGLPVFKSIFWLTALFCTEKDHEWHWKRVCTHARSSCQSLQTRGGEDVPTGHQFCYFHLGKSEKSKTRCILEYGISDTEKSVNMFSSLPQKPAEVCKILGLCSSCDKEQMLSYFAQEALQAAVTSDNVSIWSLERHIAGRKKKQKHCAELLPFMCLNQVKPSTECSFCTFLIKTLEGLLPKERTEVKHGYTAHKNSTSLCCTQTLKSNQTTQLRVITARVFFFFFLNSAPLLQEAVVKLLEEICHILPASYRNQCETVIDKVSRTVLDAILAYATPQAICHLMHFCKGEESLLVGQFVLPCFYCSDCDRLLNMSYVGHKISRDQDVQ